MGLVSILSSWIVLGRLLRRTEEHFFNVRQIFTDNYFYKIVQLTKIASVIFFITDLGKVWLQNLSLLKMDQNDANCVCVV